MKQTECYTDACEQFANLSVRETDETVHVVEYKTLTEQETIQSRLLGLPKDMERSASWSCKKGSKKGRYGAKSRRSNRRHTVVGGDEVKQIQQAYKNIDTCTSLTTPSLTKNASSESELTLYRVRSFKKTSRGIKNRGDSFKIKSNSDISVASADSGHHEDYQSRKSSFNSEGLGLDWDESENIYKVLILGAQGTGKSALAQQFMTSEYMGDCDSLLGEASVRTVSVLLNGEESSLQFLELESEEDHADYCDVDGYIVVYSVTDRRSFKEACGLIKDLRDVLQKQTAITMVANKTDIVRQRQVTDSEAGDYAKSYGCKYIETSAVLNHHIDELLVETLSNIRHVTRAKRRSLTDAAKGIVRRLFKSRKLHRSRSLEALYTGAAK